MQIRIEGSNLPGPSCDLGPDDVPHPHVHVAVQVKDRPKELLDLQAGDAPSAVWTLDVHVLTTEAGIEFAGRHIQNRLGGRFVHLSWGDVDGDRGFTLFRRAKIMLDGVPADVAAAAVESGLLIGRLGLTDAKGRPVCARVAPPVIEWVAGDPDA